MEKPENLIKLEKRLLSVVLISVVLLLVSFGIVAALNLSASEDRNTALSETMVDNEYYDYYDGGYASRKTTWTFMDGNRVHRDSYIKITGYYEENISEYWRYEIKTTLLGKATVSIISDERDVINTYDVYCDDVGVASLRYDSSDSMDIDNRSIEGNIKLERSLFGKIWFAILFACSFSIIYCFMNYISTAVSIDKQKKDAQRREKEAEKKRQKAEKMEREHARTNHIRSFWENDVLPLGFSEEQSITVDGKLIWVANNHFYQTPIFSDYVAKFSTQDEIEQLSPLPINCVDVPIEKIQYFAKEGDVQYTTKVSGGGGGGYSVAGAIVGGLIAGEAGAVIGSRKKVNDVVSKTETHDSRKTILRYFNEDSVEILSFNGFGLYEYLLGKIPEKDLLTIQLQQMSSEKASLNDATATQRPQPDAIEQIEKLAALKDKGIISDEEFQKKKEELLAKL